VEEDHRGGRHDRFEVVPSEHEDAEVQPFSVLEESGEVGSNPALDDKRIDGDLGLAR